jgi:hypothetical protein
MTGRLSTACPAAGALCSPRVPCAASPVSRLVEMAAADAAARRAHRLTLADALLTLAAARAPAGALGAVGTAGAQRIRRLIDSSGPASRTRRVAISALALIAAPAVAFSAPALALAVISHCPPSEAHSRLVSDVRPSMHSTGPGPGTHLAHTATEQTAAGRVA